MLSDKRIMNHGELGATFGMMCPTLRPRPATALLFLHRTGRRGLKGGKGKTNVCLFLRRSPIGELGGGQLP